MNITTYTVRLCVYVEILDMGGDAVNIIPYNLYITMNSFVRFDLSSASENLTDRAQRIATADETTEWANETERIIMQMRSRTLHASNTIPNRTLTIPCWERCKRKQFFMCVCLCIFTCWAVLIAVNVFIAHIQQQLLGSKPMRWYEKNNNMAKIKKRQQHHHQLNRVWGVKESAKNETKVESNGLNVFYCYWSFAGHNMTRYSCHASNRRQDVTKYERAWRAHTIRTFRRKNCR